MFHVITSRIFSSCQKFLIGDNRNSILSGVIVIAENRGSKNPQGRRLHGYFSKKEKTRPEEERRLFIAVCQAQLRRAIL